MNILSDDLSVMLQVHFVRLSIFEFCFLIISFFFLGLSVYQTASLLMAVVASLFPSRSFKRKSLFPTSLRILGKIFQEIKKFSVFVNNMLLNFVHFNFVGIDMCANILTRRTCSFKFRFIYI